MDKTLAGVIGVVAGLSAGGAAQASTADANPAAVLRAQSFAELLQPIPDAKNVLRSIDESTSVAATKDGVQVAQYYHHHHHHHHHHGYRRPRFVVPFMRRHHHHHHHHHHYY